MNINKEAVGFKKNIKKHGLHFHHNMRADPLLGIGSVDYIQIPCSFSEWLRTLDPSCIRSQDNYNQYQYKGENKNYVYWHIIGSYKNWKIIHFIDNRKQY